MVLYPSGDFGSVACYLIRQADGTVTISRGDGFVVKVGKWERSDSTVTITSRTVYREVVIIGRAIPEPEVVEQFHDMSRRGYWSLRTADRQFGPLPTFRDLDFLGAVIACDREYYDGKNYLEGPQPCRSSATPQLESPYGGRWVAFSETRTRSFSLKFTALFLTPK
jgi:hypothetical protein